MHAGEVPALHQTPGVTGAVRAHATPGGEVRGSRGSGGETSEDAAGVRGNARKLGEWGAKELLFENVICITETNIYLE